MSKKTKGGDDISEFSDLLNDYEKEKNLPKKNDILFRMIKVAQTIEENETIQTLCRKMELLQPD